MVLRLPDVVDALRLGELFEELRAALGVLLEALRLTVLAPLREELEVEPVARTVVDLDPEGETVVVRVSEVPEFATRLLTVVLEVLLDAAPREEALVPVLRAVLEAEFPLTLVAVLVLRDTPVVAVLLVPEVAVLVLRLPETGAVVPALRLAEAAVPALRLVVAGDAVLVALREEVWLELVTEEAA